MGKTKVADKSSKKDKKSEVAAVKAGRVTKPAATPKSKSKDIAKSVASNIKDKKKSKKAPTPEPESDSSSESESESEESSESSSEEEVVEKKTPAKAAPKAAAKADSDSDSSDSSDEDSDSDSSEEEKPAPKAVKKAAAKAESSDSDSDSDSSESEDEKPAAKAEATSTSDSDDSSDADSDDSSASESEEAPSKKRKAEEAAAPAIKKTKTEEPAAEEGVKNLFVGNMSWNIDEDWLRREFEGFGEIVGCRVITDRETGRAKGFGYVEFANAADAAKAQKEMHEYELDGRQLNVDFSTPRAKPDAGGARANKYGDKRSPPSNTLFLGNVSFECSNESIQEVFQEYGNITRVSLPTDRDTGSLKGFGYVDFGSQEEATAALEALNGQEIGGRAIRIDYAQPREDNG
ncbi:hypothetical protein CC77DRAFT_917230, partial [Alternaria alternata]